MKLYGFPPSPNTWKVRAVAAQLGLPLDLEFVDLTKGQSHTPDYLALNPTGRTPALVDGDFKLWESTAIMQYLASQTPNPLWPNDARIRADIMRWQSWQLAALEQGELRAADLRAAGEEVPEPGCARRRGPGQGHRELQPRSARARRPSRQATLSGRQGADARRFLGGGAAVLRQGSRAAARALCAHPRLVRAACRRCRPGARRRRRRLRLPHDR